MLEMIFMATGLLFNSWWILPLIGLMWSGQYKNWDAIYQALGMGPGGIGSVPESTGGGPAMLGGVQGMLLGNPTQQWAGPAMESSGIFQRGQDEMLAMQTAGLDANGMPRFYSESNNGNRSYGVAPSGFGFGGGAGAGSGSQGASAGSGTTGGSLAPNSAQALNVPSQLSGYNLAPGALAPNTVGGIPVASQLSTASLGAGAGAGAYAATPAVVTAGGAASTPGWWGAAKGVLGNRQLMTGIITAIGSTYGQYSDKKQAKENYNWQKSELENRRAYQQSRIDAQRNSPMGRAIPGLMAAVLGIYQSKLAKRGVNLNLSELFGAPPAQSGVGGDGGMQALIMSLMGGR